MVPFGERPEGSEGTSYMALLGVWEYIIPGRGTAVPKSVLAIFEEQ